MKDEEMALEYSLKINGFTKEDCYDKNGELRQFIKSDMDIFLAGLKAGRPQWHDLRKDPKDLPEKYIPVLNQYGEHRSYDGHYWRDCDDVIYTDVIAWCEIPTFDKE